jgi:DNA-binding transcriptional ArsR family regulator
LLLLGENQGNQISFAFGLLLAYNKKGYSFLKKEKKEINMESNLRQENEEGFFNLKYLKFEPQLFLNKKLNLSDCLVFGIIELYDGENHCYASNSHIAMILDTTTTTVSTSISKLKEEGYIEEVSFDGRKRVLRVKCNYKDTHTQTIMNLNRRFNECLNYNNKILKLKDDKVSSKEETKEKQVSPLSEDCRDSSSYKKVKVLNRRILTKAQQIKSAGVRQRCSITINQGVRITPPVRDILEHWIGLGLYLPKETTKDYITGVEKIKRLLSGYQFNKKFTVDDIKIAISNFSLAALDNDFEPSNLVYKKILKKTSLSSFIENSFSNGEKSMFLKYFSSPPEIKKSDEKLLQDSYPSLTKKIKDIYRAKVLSNSKIKFNIREENCFIKASQRIQEFFKENSIHLHLCSTLSDSEKVQYLWNAILADIGESVTSIRKVTPGWFCSDATFHHRYPAYLTQQGILFSEEEQTSSLYELNRELRKEEQNFSDAY